MRRRIALVSLVAALPGTALAQTLQVGDLTMDRLVTGLFEPTAAEYLPDGRLVIIEKSGQISVQPAIGGRLIRAGNLPTNDRMGNEQGALGLAVDPMFATTNRLYFYYSRSNTSSSERNRVGYATIDPMTSQVDVANITEIVTDIYGPANHDGGALTFGPDGHLYIGTGDTGCNSGRPPGRNNARNFFGTCLSNLSGKVLRVDREGNTPPGNPLIGVNQVRACGADPRPGCSTEPTGNNLTAPRTEIWNWGFRNIWRMSFDSMTGHLWIGDVGEVSFEEITIATGPGQHHGWPFREGDTGDNPAVCTEFTPSAAGPCKAPAHTLTRQQGRSITGGVFSNHCSWPSPYRGQYWFGDYVAGRVWTLTPNAARDDVMANSRREIVRNAGGPVHFFNGNDGALLFIDINNGRIQRLRPTNPETCAMDASVPDATPAAPDATPAAPDATPAPMDATPSAMDANPAAMDAPPAAMDATQVADDAAAGRPDVRSSAADAGAGRRQTPDAESGFSCHVSGSPHDHGLLAALLLGLLAIISRGSGVRRWARRVARRRAARGDRPRARR